MVTEHADESITEPKAMIIEAHQATSTTDLAPQPSESKPIEAESKPVEAGFAEVQRALIPTYPTSIQV